MEIPKQAINLISEFEGCLLSPYKDSAGLWTIGIGHLILPSESFTTITNDQAQTLLKSDMRKAVQSVSRLITRPLTDNQYAALLSFTFNLGGGTLQRSTLRKKCNRTEDEDVPTEFMKYVYVGKQKIYGLTRRRKAEAMLYMAE